jgi:hypothetical protein
LPVLAVPRDVQFRTLVVAAALLVAGALGVVAVDADLLGGPGEYDRTTVRVVDAGHGETLATVEVRVADTPGKRYTGLSNTSSLSADEGMLFVHPSNGHYAYVMRDMEFPLDIVFVADNGTITRIHHAPLDPPGTTGGDLTRYEGFGRYVLEVPYGYANRTGIEAGDRVHVEGDY